MKCRLLEVPASAGGPLRPSVLFLHQWFWPEMTAVSQMLTDLVEDLARGGFTVTVLTSRAGLLGKTSDLPHEENYKGARIIRTYSPGFGRRGNLLRFVDFATFWLSCFCRALRLPRHDVVVALTTPPFIIWIGILLRCAKGSRCAYWVQDLYPDLAIKLGVLRNSCTCWILEMASRTALRLADVIVPISVQMGAVIAAKGVRRQRIRVVENWASGSEIYPLRRERNWFLTSHGLEGRFVVQYSGNMGAAHEFQTILEAAEELRDSRDVVFIFIGDGPKCGDVIDFVARKSLRNVLLLPYQPRSALLYSLNAGDVALVSLLPCVDGLMLPSKLYGILAVGRPVIAICDEGSELGVIVRKHGCGDVVSVGDVNGLVQSIMKYKCDPGLVARVGNVARQIFETNWERKVATARFGAVISEVQSRSSSKGA